MTALNNLPEVKSKPAFGYDETDVETKTFTGGKPYVNDSFTYPVDKDNKPLRFFCQLDLSEVDERVKKYLNLPDLVFYSSITVMKMFSVWILTTRIFLKMFLEFFILKKLLMIRIL